MEWWINIYLTIISMLAIASSIEERRMGFGWYHITFSLLSIFVVVIGVIAYFNEGAASTLGRLLLPLVVTSLAWGLYGGAKNLRKMTPFEDMSVSENIAIRKMGIIISVIILLPGYILGAIAGVSAW